MKTAAAHDRRLARALLGLVALVAGWLRWRQAQQSLVFDEMASLYFSCQPWRHLFGWWMLRETNPPLFYAMLKLWRLLVPMGPLAMRALPLAIAAATLALLARVMARRMGWAAATLALAFAAISASDIYQAAYLRGYGLSRLAVLVSFIGLVAALETPHRRRALALYAAGALVAVYCHTTMLLWPVIATAAAGIEAVWSASGRRRLVELIIADLAIALGAFWVIAVAWVQLRSHARANLDWIKPLGWDDFAATCNLQLLTGGTASAMMMALAMAAGAWRGRHRRDVRLALAIVLLAIAVFKAADALHPIISDFTLHWAFSFTALIAGAALLPPQGRPRAFPALAVLLAGAVIAAGLADIAWFNPQGIPQDWRRTVRTVAADPRAALLASHEAEGVVIEQSCLVEFGSLHCPFPLVVMADPSPTDNWATGGYHGALVDPAHVRRALGTAAHVYAFSRYVYTPLQHLGLDPGDWQEIFWDDGELIGPIPISAFDPPGPGEPARKPDWHAEYVGAPD